VITPPEDQVPGDTLVTSRGLSVSAKRRRIVNEVTVREVYNVEIIDIRTLNFARWIVDMYPPSPNR